MKLKKINHNLFFNPLSLSLQNKINLNYKYLSIDDLFKINKTFTKNILELVITTTTKCNLACEYCFENNLIRTDMTEEICEKLKEDIKLYIQKYPDIKILKIIFFGGEPFLNIPLFNNFVLFFKKLDLETKFYIKTNGLISLEIIPENFFEEVQITFDGNEIANNMRRVSKDPKINSYQEIFKKLNYFEKIAKNLTLKFNFDYDNYETFDFFLIDVMTTINKFNLNREKITIYLEAVQSIKNIEYKKHIKESSSELAEKYILLLEKIINYNLRYKTSIFTQPCMLFKEHSFLITENGMLSSCIMSFSDEPFYIGNSLLNSNKKNQITKKESLLKNTKCKSCEYIACCWGGCNYEIYNSNLDIYTNQNCKKQFYDNILIQFYDNIYLKYGVTQF